ncbi:MAG TPA: Uma2 family endonuclease [Blastocatellia bacterium]|nr:Uma2 family endonuclease [Blastocatellia bacterium]
MTLAFERKLFTTAEYHRMIEAGILHEDDHVELLNGEIINMAPIGPRHAACVDRISDLLWRKARKAAIIRVQNPVGLSPYSEPQPDISLLKLRSDYYAHGHPAPDDVLVAIEVADTTLEYDRNAKIPAYARAGIAEAWLVDLNNDRIEIYTQPDQGFYREIRLVSRKQRVISTTIPGLSLKADDILG